MEEIVKRIFEKESLNGFQSLSTEERNVLVVWIAQGAIDNGGLTALCVNSAGSYIQHMPDAFLSIGATEAAHLLNQFIAWFKPFRPSPWRWLREFHYYYLLKSRAAEFDSLDDEWDSVEFDIDRCLELYIQSNFGH